MGKKLAQKQQHAMLRRGLQALRVVKERTGNIVWMSAEPVSWDLAAICDAENPLDWIVIGAASHRHRYFQPEAQRVRHLLLLMDQTATPVFYKGNIRPLFEANDLGTRELCRRLPPPSTLPRASASK